MPEWGYGSMVFIVRHELEEPEGGEHKFTSKKGECPSTFIARILKTCKHEMNGEAVWAYLKQEMEAWERLQDMKRKGVKKDAILREEKQESFSC